MSDFFTYGPAGFMNALAHPIDTGNRLVDAEQAALQNALNSLTQGAKHAVVGTANLAGKTAATATQPMAGALSDVGQGMSAAAGFLAIAAEKAESVSKKILLGELVLAGVTVLGVGAAIFLARKPGIMTVLLGRARE